METSGTHAESRSGWDAIASRLIAYTIVIAGVTTAIWLMLRNEPFREPMLAYSLRIFLALAAGVTAREIPGMFRLKIAESESGKKITANGAIGFAVLTYLTAPAVAPNLDPENVQQRPPEVFPCRVWRSNEYVVTPDNTFIERPQTARVQWISWFVERLQSLEQEQEIQGVLVPTLIAETPAFSSPYQAFNAVVRISVPPKNAKTKGGSHTILAFLVHGEDARRTFTPLVCIHSSSVESTMVHVPETRRGDYLFFLIQLNPSTKRPINLNKGEFISMQLFVL